MNEQKQDAPEEITTLGDDQPMYLLPDGETVSAGELAAIDQEENTLAAFERGVQLWDEKRKLILGWIRDSLVEGTDYGRIHVVSKSKCPDGNRCENPAHYSKPSLWKAGAEKIAGMMQLRAEWPDLHEELQTIKAGSQFVALRCILLNKQGDIVSEGVGARDLKQDYNDPNKALKMAKKSSLIDAVLNAGGLSEIFTQDLSHEERPQGTSVPLTDEGIDYLHGTAKQLFGDQAGQVLESLARRRFRIDSGDWKQIPDSRLADAVRSLEEKADAS